MFEDIDKNTLMVSDTHFDHKHILKFCPSRQIIVDQLSKGMSMEDFLIKQIWKKNKNKVIFHLGDFSFKGSAKYEDTIKNSKTYFIPGNHDKNHVNYYKARGFDVIDAIYVDNKRIIINEEFPYALVKNIGDQRVLFSHFPLFNECVFDKQKKFYKTIEFLEKIYIEEKCTINIHGHTHEESSKFKDSFNVSIDNINYTPLKLSEILK